MFALYYERGKVNHEPAMAIFEYVPPHECGRAFAEDWCRLEEAGPYETVEQAATARDTIQRATRHQHRYVV